MARFTVGSILTGAVIAGAGVVALEQLRAHGAVVMPAAPGDPAAAVDGSRPMVTGDDTHPAADASLHDADDWGGGMDAATW
jgi:hypothetical protein